MVEADQEKGTDACQLPEHKHQKHVVRQHKTQHRGHEYADIDVKPACLRIRLHINACIEKHRSTDQGDDQHEAEAQAVEKKGKVDTERGNPQHRFPDNLSGRNLRVARQKAEKHEQGKRHGNPAEVLPEPFIKHRRKSRRAKTYR